jgi:hypothetical protein
MQILSAPAGGTTSAPGTLITGPQLSISSGTPFTGVTAEWIVEKESYTNAEGVSSTGLADYGSLNMEFTTYWYQAADPEQPPLKPAPQDCTVITMTCDGTATGTVLSTATQDFNFNWKSAS